MDALERGEPDPEELCHVIPVAILALRLGKYPNLGSRGLFY